MLMLQKFRSCSAQVEKDRERIENILRSWRDSSRQASPPKPHSREEGFPPATQAKLKICSLYWGITTIQQNYPDNQLVVTPNEMIGVYCRD